MADEAMKARLESAYGKVPLQRLVRPGRVLSFMRCTWGTWSLPGVSLEQLQASLEKLSAGGFAPISSTWSKAPYFRLSEIKTTSAGQQYIEINFLTPGPHWLDCCTLRVASNADGNLNLTYYNASSGMIPLRFPFPTLLGCLLVWFPFGDKAGYTKTTMLALKTFVDADLNISSEMTCKRYVPSS